MDFQGLASKILDQLIKQIIHRKYSTYQIKQLRVIDCETKQFHQPTKIKDIQELDFNYTPPGHHLFYNDLTNNYATNGDALLPV